MRLDYVDFWGIVDNYEEALASNVDPKVKKRNTDKNMNNAISIIALNMADNQLVCIRSCRRPTIT